MGIMDSPDPVIAGEVLKLLTVAETAKILAIMDSHRRRLIVDLPSGARAIVNAIIRTARLRPPGERKPQAPEVATVRAAREKAQTEMARASDPHHSRFQKEHATVTVAQWQDRQRTH